ncbi:phosphoribosylformylglycinamidine cyclo-ligase [Halorhabdus utahensis DSM 12940]|uniref:Phosphoribosylformylglycinamidine cyclo-ligase n=1 Tax=Halorhabdus utahensis (strain DSM 12940 / JCM 11049 / AX-2) TaxID=519442 RepID=C7NS13_HALUD|nr:phosphoribosylformylglycinamidine cyclo-ligase [Halorhabdus utahensis]ACV10620.1 phosphoribosylformylglycinamidine cyclo-ligase [Halorhabdus utahensis DSM 12940]
MAEHEADDGDGASSSDATDEPDEELTYAASGVDIDESEAATEALLDAAGEFAGDFAGLVDIGDRYLALATDGVGTKLLVAEALDDYSTVGIDCIAMNVNDLVAAGIEPVAFVDYLAIEAPDSTTTGQLGEGLQIGAELADIALIGGETAVMPDVIDGLDIAGTAAGLAPKDGLFAGEAEPGDAIVGWPSSGIHSNGLTLAREAVTRDHDYDDPFPPEPSTTIGEELLAPTRIYTDLLDPLREHGTHAAAHVTGGGWRNLTRMGPYRYEIEEPFDAQPIFEFVQTVGDVSDAEMHRTFNMGTGFVATFDPADAMNVVEETADGRIIGRVVDSDEGVSIRGLDLQ